MNAPAVSVRPLSGDAEARFCAEFIVASDPWVTIGLTFEQALQRLSDRSREIFISTVDEQIVGILILHRSGPLNGYIQLLAVHPDWRCRGIGSQLVAWAEERIFRESPNVFLCVSSFNTHAQKLYQRLGYEKVGEFPDFVVKGYSEFLMRKTRGTLLGYQPKKN